MTVAQLLREAVDVARERSADARRRGDIDRAREWNAIANETSALHGRWTHAVWP